MFFVVFSSLRSTSWRLGRLGLLAAFGSCRPATEPPCLLLNTDFEQFEGWIRPLPAFLSTEQAHSGRYAYRVLPGEEFGSGFSTTLGACGFVPGRLRLSSWVYLPNGRVGSTYLVLSINCHGRRPDVWAGLQLSEVVKRYQRWEPVHKIIRLPSDLAPTDELKVYVWHAEPSGTVTWLDDLKLEAWP